MNAAQAFAEFVIACNLVEIDRNKRIARLYPLVRGLVAASYGAKLGLRRHLDDLAAEGAVGLVEAVDAGLVGEALARAILEHVEVKRLKVGPMSMSPDDVARHASAVPTAEETMVAREGGTEPIRRIAPRPRDLRPAIARLPERDRLLVHAYYHQRKSVRQLGAELGISGMAVSYRLRLIRERLRVLVNLPALTSEEIRVDLGELVGEKRAEVLAAYYETMSQSEAGERVGVDQRAVCHTVHNTIERLATIHRLAKYHKAFSIIAGQRKWWDTGARMRQLKRRGT